MKPYQSKKIGISLISVGVGIIIGIILSYPLFLPTVISRENSIWIDQISYIFYAVLFGGVIFAAFGIHKVFQMWNYRINVRFSSPSSSSINSLSSNSRSSIFKIIINIVNDKKYFRFFWPASIGYGLFYALVSSMIIYRTDNISELYGVTVPSLVMISYGPLGYVPTMSAYLNEHIGLLIIPINLIVTLIVSALVGFNTVLSAYAFAQRPKKSINTATGTSSVLSILGATTSLFATCPTCASFYIFNVMAGSLAPTVAAFAISYYALFVAISIPLLLATFFITALSIRRMLLLGKCFLK
jgi:hypothetical protein